MEDISETPFLIGTAALVAISIVFSIVAISTNGWAASRDLPFLTEYNNATDKRKEELLWLVGVCVLVILGILCLFFTSIIVTARFFKHSQGRLKLGGTLSACAGLFFVVALIIFMLNHRPDITTYGYSFGLLWTSVPLSLASGVLLFMLPDSPFLYSELESSSASVK